MKLTAKSEWYKFFHSNIFNKTNDYTPDIFIQSFYDQNIDLTSDYAIRNTKKSGATFVVRPFEEMFMIVSTLLKGGEISFKEGGVTYKELNEYTISEKAPDNHIIVQGEFDGFKGRVSHIKKPMRYAFQEEEIYLENRGQLISQVGFDNYEKIMDCLDMFDNSNDYWDRYVVEFSLYDRPVGIHKENLIIWEIRKY